jgi:hypothetical protein
MEKPVLNQALQLRVRDVSTVRQFSSVAVNQISPPG